jgi:hypothetical protein
VEQGRSRSGAFPRGNGAGAQPELWMRAGARHLSQCTVLRRGTTLQLAQQVRPLEVQLTTRAHESHGGLFPADLRAVEPISTSCCLGVHYGEVRVDGGDWIARGPKALELRMTAVPPGASAQDGPRQQPFTPEGHKAGGVQVTRMQGPEAHASV